MKKGYLLLPAFLIGTAFAQQNVEGPAVLTNDKALSKTEFMPRSAVNSGNRAPGDPISTETFSSIGSWTTSGPGSSGGSYSAAQLWLHDTNGPDGYYSDNSQIIQSPTVGDGFMILDGDFFNGTGGPPSSVESYNANLVSPVYNLNGISNVSVSFYQSYRLCCSSAEPQLWMEVSTDGFANVAATYDVTYADAPINVTSGTRQHFINITNDIAGNPANTQIRFRWGTNGSSNNASHYFWQIDDVVVYETWTNHGQLDTLNWSADVTNYGDFGGFQKIPSYAAGVTTLSWTGYMDNLGAGNWTNAQMKVDQNGSTFATGTGQSVNAGSLSAKFTAAATMPTTQGLYTYTVTGIADQTMDLMDSATFTIEVTEDEYSTGGSVQTGIQSGTNWNWTTQPVRVGFGGEIITTAANEAINGVRVVFQDTSKNAFAPMEVVILVNGTEVATKQFTVDGNNMGVPQYVQLDAQVQLSAGDVVDFLVVDSDAEGRFIESGTDAYHIGLLVTYDGSNVMSGPYLEAPAMIGMVTWEGMVSVDENESSINTLGQNWPNPFDNNTTIKFTLANSEMCSFEVVDVTGKVVKTIDLGSRGAGQHQIELNANEFNKGIYFYTLTAGANKMTKKMVVTK
ncbi:MAG: T9SS type A sorting domain-containing protein [Crocinitomicaceae bacterium]|nr:T9SS type A sorting domain-containing protein [Crocinitomicaceae bacterium]